MLELVSKESNHFAPFCMFMLGFNFYEVKKNITIFQKEEENTIALFIIFTVKLQKQQNLLL